jgi:large subunit ribosomal protein L18
MKLSPKETAFKVGEVMGDRISEKKINKKISFDRGPYLFHGRVEELAKGVRSKGIKF